MSSYLKPAGPPPDNGPSGPAVPAADWPVTDWEDREEWVRRLNNVASELDTLGRHSNTYKIARAANMIASFLSMGANPDELEVVLRNLSHGYNHDTAGDLRPQDLSWRYFSTRSDRPNAATGVEVKHLPTGLSAWGDRHRTRLDNHGEAYERLAALVAAQHDANEVLR